MTHLDSRHFCKDSCAAVGWVGCWANAEKARSTRNMDSVILQSVLRCASPAGRIAATFSSKSVARNRSKSGRSETCPHTRTHSHPIVIRPTATLRRNPGDDLIRVMNVAGFAVHAVRWIQADALSVGLRGVINHFINIRWTEVLARAAKFFNAALIANVSVLNDQVCGLIFFMLRTRVIKIGELVEGELAVAFGVAEQMSFVAAVSGEHRQLLHTLISGSRRIPVAHSASASELLQASVQHSSPKAVLEALMEVANLPQLIFDPA